MDIQIFGDYKAVKKKIINMYKQHDVCMAELLASICCVDLTMEDVFNLYIELMSKIENDIFIRLNDDEQFSEILKGRGE